MNAQCWNNNVIIQKRDMKDCANCRYILLISMPANLLTRMLDKRVGKTLGTKLGGTTWIQKGKKSYLFR